MFDGALNVYDLEELRSPPELVVLPACNAAMNGARSGEQLVGTSSALLGIGVRTVIAPMSVINDEATVAVMQNLHRALADGADGAQALRRAREHALDDSEPAGVAVVSALVCLE
jgi:CHAT domain-containing protein